MWRQLIRKLLAVHAWLRSLTPNERNALRWKGNWELKFCYRLLNTWTADKCRRTSLDRICIWWMRTIFRKRNIGSNSTNVKSILLGSYVLCTSVGVPCILKSMSWISFGFYLRILIFRCLWYWSLFSLEIGKIEFVVECTLRVQNERWDEA